MPNQPSWLLRVNEILDDLAGAEMAAHPFLTRAAVEKLFGLKRRQAIELIHSVEGYQIGETVEARRAAQRVFDTRNCRDRCPTERKLVPIMQFPPLTEDEISAANRRTAVP